MTTLKSLAFFSALMAFFSASAQVDTKYDDNLPINKIQVLGSHNSYRKLTEKPLWNWLNALGKLAKGKLKPAQQIEYNHVALDSQLQVFGLRHFEIDIYNDPKGGHYYKRQGNVLVGKSKKSNVDALLWGGMKVLHIPDIDYNTNYYTLKDALKSIKKWSDNNSTHFPIYIYIELKNSAISDYVNICGFKKAIPFDENALLSLRDEIYSVFDTTKIIKPDDIRGDYNTLREAVIQHGFPKLKDARGKVLFVLNASSSKKILDEKYPSFAGLPFFAFSNVQNNDAAFLLVDNPKEPLIEQAVKEGFIVRTRADADTREARDNDYSSFEAAKKSGAQMISTDFYMPFKKTGYVLTQDMLLK